MLAARSSPASQQELVYSSGINSTMMNNVLLGAYSIVYFRTIYLYWTRKSSQLRFPVISAITAIYALYVVQSAIAWYRLDITFKLNSQSNGPLAPFFGPGWYHLLANACFSIETEIADALMIWRCYHVWNKSFRAIAPAAFLVVVQVGIFIATLVILSVHDLKPPVPVANVVNKLIAASAFVTLFSTLMTTLLISYRIHSMMQKDGVIQSYTRFKNVADILVQSAAAYSFVLLIYAAASVSGVRDAALFSFQFYLTCLCSFVAGIAPTIMIARLANPNPRVSFVSMPVHFTGLRFEDTSTNTDSTELRSGIRRSSEGVHFAKGQNKDNIHTIVVLSLLRLQCSDTIDWIAVAGADS